LEGGIMKVFLMSLVYFFGIMSGMYIGMMCQEKQKWKLRDYGFYFMLSALAVTSGYYALK